VQRYCETCGTQVSETAAFCSGCGNKVINHPLAPPPRTESVQRQNVPERTETVLLDERGIKVTNARFLVDGQTYAMAGVTSVKTEVEHPSQRGPYVVIGIGGLLFLNGTTGQSGALLAGALVFALGVMWFRSRKSEYLVLLTTASGEKRPYKSNDEVFVRKVVKAINDAFVHRG
jgi:hypothetical protein